ncbi:long-chain fatty acid--CoA ligase [uncultured Ferrimonas sp.]|uniref:AMP-dependent synthetase/ligase n=1 Tax=uncultured Ferrimonas sp. TaxID=432640 RepID=UPI002624B4AC|nr:long-chain fatty acid--CoA ligase [uncultured Ferrimonas sp.]
MPLPLSPFLLAKQIRSAGQQHAGREAVRFQQDGQWRSLTWKQLLAKVEALAAALLGQGCAPQDKIAILSHNSIEWLIADLACLAIRAVSVPIYATSSQEQIQYILNDAEVKLLFVGDQQQYNTANSLSNACPHLRGIITMASNITALPGAIAPQALGALLQTDPSPHRRQLVARLNSIALDDLFTLIYTSGTTGEPKGVMLSQGNMAAVVQQHHIAVPVEENTLSLSFLPLSHVYERSWSLYVLCCGGRVAYLSDPTQVQQALTDVQPQVMCAVPRLFEKIHSAITSKVATAPLHKRLLFAWSLHQGRRQFNAEMAGRRRALLPRLLHALADKLILQKLRNVLGGQLQLMSVGGARLDEQVNQFFQYIGIALISGYGATETSATVTCHRSHDRRTSGVGLPLPDLQVRIGANDEILVKGATIMPGYYNRPQDTAAAFENGWLKTGDAGYLDKEGHLHITDRIKELMKTSNGKYIAPQRVEGMVAREPLIEQIAINADGRNFVAALIVPDHRALGAWAKQQGLRFGNNAELIALPQVVQLMAQRIAASQSELARYEKVKQFTLLDRPFSIDRGELTPTLKLRRRVINEVFADDINAMYQRQH